MKRKLLVSTVDKAVEMMRAFLSSQLIDVKIDLFDNKKSGVMLAWFSREIDSDVWIGCPCFVADFKGKLPGGDGKCIRGIVYVKCFPTQSTQITKMKVVDDYLDCNFCFIEDGETFVMQDDQRRFKDETFIYENGEIKLR